MKKIINWSKDNWFKLLTSLLLFSLVMVVFADYGARVESEKNRNNPISIQTDTNNNPITVEQVSTGSQDREAYIKQLQDRIAQDLKVNQQWVAAQSNWEKMKANYESQIANLKTDNQTLVRKTVEGFQTRINNLSMSMTDPSWQNSLLNDMTMLIPQPGTYTQEQATNDRKIALINVYSWAGVGVCAILDDYVKAGIISSRGDSCSSRANIASQIK